MAAASTDSRIGITPRINDALDRFFRNDRSLRRRAAPALTLIVAAIVPPSRRSLCLQAFGSGMSPSL